MINKYLKFRGMDLDACRRGSAMLVAILMMGVLMTLTLGLSTLIVREIRQTGDIVSAGQAYFAAEAGMENALFDLAETLPGYETEVSYPVEEEEDEFLNYEYRIGNKGDAFPYFPEDELVFLDPNSAVPSKVLYDEFPERTYNVLPLNESVTIPLFTVGDDGSINNIDSFLVQYYVNFADRENFAKIQRPGQAERKIKLDEFDILRWKLFGNPCDDQETCNNYDSLTTDAISDFYPATDDVSADSPVCIGTPDLLNSGYQCIAPVIEDVTKVGEYDYTNVNEIWDSAGFSFARQCFVSEVSNKVVGSLQGDVVMKKCTIENFINTHTKNYLTLTNMVNPDIVGINPDTTPQYANIYYRIVTGEKEQNKIVREFADIKSDGFSRDGSVVQSVNAKLRMSSFLPVFNFSLYRTDTTTDVIDSPFQVIEQPKFTLQSQPVVPALQPLSP